MKGYADLGDFPEDTRIAAVCDTAAHGHVVGCVTDDEPGKPERYIEKIRRDKRVRVIDSGPGPVANTILIRVGPAES